MSNLEQFERNLREIERQGRMKAEAKARWAKGAHAGWQWPLAARARALAGFMSTCHPSTPLQPMREVDPKC